MSKFFLLNLMTGVASLFILLLPSSVWAAQLSFKPVPNNVNSDGAVLVEVRLDPQSKILNVVEGIINFQGTIANDLTVAVETDGSILTLWPTPPKYFPEEKVIRFTGGVPGGFNQESLLFRLRLSSGVAGNAIISWLGGNSYLNDGQGTKENVSSLSLTINLEQQTSNKVNITPSGHQTKKTFTRFVWLKNAIIILTVVIFFFFLSRYVYKKIIKK